jgi:hypothetical protein
MADVIAATQVTGGLGVECGFATRFWETGYNPSIITQTLPAYSPSKCTMVPVVRFNVVSKPSRSCSRSVGGSFSDPLH